MHLGAPRSFHLPLTRNSLRKNADVDFEVAQDREDGLTPIALRAAGTDRRGVVHRVVCQQMQVPARRAELIGSEGGRRGKDRMEVVTELDALIVELDVRLILRRRRWWRSGEPDAGCEERRRQQHRGELPDRLAGY